MIIITTHLLCILLLNSESRVTVKEFVEKYHLHILIGLVNLAFVINL